MHTQKQRQRQKQKEPDANAHKHTRSQTPDNDAVIFSYVRWYTEIFCYVRWYSAIFSDVRWYTAIFSDVRWCTAIFSDVRWCAVISIKKPCPIYLTKNLDKMTRFLGQVRAARLISPGLAASTLKTVFHILLIFYLDKNVRSPLSQSLLSKQPEY